MGDRVETKSSATKTRLISGVCVLAVFFLAGLAVVEGQQRTPRRATRLAPGSSVSLDFDNADIRVVIKHISELTGRNFLVDEKVRGRVTIITPAKIPASDVFQVFLSVLHTYGFTAVPAGGVTKILPLAEVGRSGVPMISPSQTRSLSPSDRFVTSIVRLIHADPTGVSTLLRRMISRAGSVVPYAPSNVLIITDTAANVRRVTSIIGVMDVPPAKARVEIVRLKYAVAKELAATLDKLVEQTVTAGASSLARRARRTRGARVRRGSASAKKAVKIIPEDRVNALILVAPPTEMVRLQSLVKKLDVPPEPERKRIHVYRLENALAEDIARVLTQQIDTTSKTQTSKRRDRTRQEGRGGRRPTERTSVPTTSSTSRSRKASSGFRSRAGEPLLEDVSITPDKATNSLIIRASPEDYLTLRAIIRKLDVQRSQVLVEALIAEMTLDKSRELGVEWRLLNKPSAGGTSVVGGTNLPLPGSTQGIINQFATTPFAGPSGLVLGASRGLVTFGGQTFFDLRSLVRAFQLDSDINLLSTPQILTTDNEEAEIVVGENRPFVTQSQTTAEGSTVQNFEFRDIGVTLRITPHISPNRFVRLKIFQEITNFVKEAQVGAVTTTKRQATTSVTVADGETVVIGGLISDDVKDEVTKVPLLGDIPLVGALFRTKRKSRDKTNLLIFITPRIVLTPSEHRQLTEFKKRETGQLLPPKPKSVKDKM